MRLLLHVMTTAPQGWRRRRGTVQNSAGGEHGRGRAAPARYVPGAYDDLLRTEQCPPVVHLPFAPLASANFLRVTMRPREPESAAQYLEERHDRHDARSG